MAPAPALYIVPSPKKLRDPDEARRTSSAVEPKVQGVHQLLREALRCVERGDSRRAWTLVKQAIALFPRNPHVYQLKGDLFLREGKAFEAALEFRKALSLDETLATAELGLGTALLELGHQDEAILYLDSGIHRLEAMSPEARRAMLGVSAAAVTKTEEPAASEPIVRPKTYSRPSKPKSPHRDFIIGSMHSVKPATAADISDEPSDLVMASRASIVNQMAIDLWNRVNQWTHSPITRANTLLRVLAPLSNEQKGELALSLLRDWAEEELALFSGAGLRALKDALRWIPSERADEVDEKLEALLAQATHLSVEVLSRGIVLICDCRKSQGKRALREFEERAQKGIIPAHTAVVVVLPQAECSTPKAALVEYLQRVVPEFPSVAVEAIETVNANQFAWPNPWKWVKHLWQRVFKPSQDWNSEEEQERWT